MSANHPRSFMLFLALGTAVLGGAGLFAWHHFRAAEDTQTEQARAKAAQLAAGPSVTVSRAQRGSGVRRLALVGEAVPTQSAVLYSKLSGYLTRMHADVGDAVKAGQVLAEIQAPEIDAQVATLEADLENRLRVARRARELSQAGFYSQQAVDNAEADVKVLRARIAELRTQAAYRTIRAPFAGMITSRYADPGAMVTTAASSQTAAQPLFALADTSRLEVAVFAEQAEAPAVRPGLEVEVSDAAAPERRVTGRVARVAGELDTRTRTRRVEVDFDNRSAGFVPGSFVNVAILLPVQPLVEVPAGALVTRDRKTWVATVDGQRKARLLPVVVATTDGKVLRVATGLEEGATVIVSPPAGLADGAAVNPQSPPGASPPAPAPAPAPGTQRPAAAGR